MLLPVGRAAVWTVDSFDRGDFGGLEQSTPTLAFHHRGYKLQERRRRSAPALLDDLNVSAYPL
jgi:hypothetical protein